jgi:transcriptional regulator with XRE-family HTH domain
VDAKRIGQKIEALLQKKEWSQRDLARRLGVQPPNVNRWIKGHIAPSAASLQKLSAVLRVPIEELL